MCSDSPPEMSTKAKDHVNHQTTFPIELLVFKVWYGHWAATINWQSTFWPRR
jgi:hypothetical protein